jgi:hypothetical protein
MKKCVGILLVGLIPLASEMFLMNTAWAGHLSDAIFDKDTLKKVKTLSILPPDSQWIIKTKEGEKSVDELIKPLSDMALKEVTNAFADKGLKVQHIYIAGSTPVSDPMPHYEISQDEYEKILQVSKKVCLCNSKDQMGAFTISTSIKDCDVIVMLQPMGFIINENESYSNAIASGVITGVAQVLTGVFTPPASSSVNARGLYFGIIIYDPKTGKVLWYKDDRLYGQPEPNKVGGMVKNMLSHFPDL